MGLELGRALLLADAVTPQAMSRALLTAVKDDVSLVRALLSTDAVDPTRLEEELARVAPDTPVQRHPVPVLDLVERLPARMCEALMAIPVRRDPRTGTVDVAVADALDTHAADEIGFHLGAPVRVVRAPLSALEEGLARLREPRPEATAGSPPAPRVMRGAPVVAIDSSAPGADALVSERPLPLVNRSAEPALAHDIPIPLSRRIPSPRAPAPAPGPVQNGLQLELDDLDDEPVVELRRTKSSKSMLAVKPEAPSAEAPPPPVVPPESAPGFPMHQVLGDMTRAEARDPLMGLVLRAVHSAAPKAALFAAKKEAFVGWMCTPAFGDPEELEEVRVDVRVPSVFATTAAAGAYVGPLLRNGPHAPLFAFVKSADPEVLAVSIKAAGKPAVIVFAYDVPDSRHAMTVMVEVARVAGEALERIVRNARGEPMSQRGGYGPASRR